MSRPARTDPAVTEPRPAFDFAAALQESIAKGQVKVPPFPAVAIKLSDLVRRQDYGLKDVVNLVSADPVLAMEVIRCSNTAHYGRGEVTALQPAVQRVGAQEVVRLAMVSGLASATRARGSLTRLSRSAWHDAVAGALVAQQLARQRSLPPDQGFLCGLLHDFGWLLALQAVEELLQKHPREVARDASCWAEMVEREHVACGVRLAESWRLPAVLHDVIALHHSVEAARSPHAPMIEVIRATDQVVRLIWSRPHVSAADLAALDGLRPAETAGLAAALPGIAPVIDSFEKEIAGRPSLPKVTRAPKRAAAPGEWRPLELPVRLHAPKRRSAYRLKSIGACGWILCGADPIQDGLLLDAELGEGAAALRHWARTAQCTLAVDGFEIECRPLLLSEPANQRWLELQRAAA